MGEKPARESTTVPVSHQADLPFHIHVLGNTLTWQTRRHSILNIDMELKYVLIWCSRFVVEVLKNQ